MTTIGCAGTVFCNLWTMDQRIILDSREVRIPTIPVHIPPKGLTAPPTDPIVPRVFPGWTSDCLHVEITVFGTWKGGLKTRWWNLRVLHPGGGCSLTDLTAATMFLLPPHLVVTIVMRKYLTGKSKTRLGNHNHFYLIKVWNIMVLVYISVIHLAYLYVVNNLFWISYLIKSNFRRGLHRLCLLPNPFEF